MLKQRSFWQSLFGIWAQIGNKSKFSFVAVLALITYVIVSNINGNQFLVTGGSVASAENSEVESNELVTIEIQSINRTSGSLALLHSTRNLTTSKLRTKEKQKLGLNQNNSTSLRGNFRKEKGKQREKKEPKKEKSDNNVHVNDKKLNKLLLGLE